MSIDMIINKREFILIGEIGALLHDIGKCHPNFIKTQSKENIRGLPHHARKIDELIAPELIECFKQLKVKLGGDEKSIYDFIKQHHNASGMLLGCLEKCDKKDSADDKGIVRQKQHVNDTWISSPFGYPKEKIDLDCLQKRFDDLQDNLKGLFANYISGTMSLTCFRESLMNNLRTAFSHALGETRIPSNDVTLWDHSYSTASLFKSVLAAIACKAVPGLQDLKWRILGICWDGLGFINKGRKIAETKAREEIIRNIKKELKKKLEDEIPIGNAIYENINGIYFTFPEFNDSKELAKECAEIALKVVYEKSSDELWSFFTLSKTSGTLTIIADELKFASEKRKIPKMTPALFVEGKREYFFENPKITIPVKGQDICPICRIRPKGEKKERCYVCEERRRGRLLQWLSNMEDTIWVDEVADKNNRIALISLNFYLDKWLDGTMIETIYSQSFEDWLDKEKENLYKIQDELKNKINEKAKEKKELEQKIKQLIFTLRPDKETAYKVLDVFWEVKDKNKATAAKILDTFFEEIIGLNENTLEKHLSNIEERIDAGGLTKENLATYLFTQNPSPARLYRIWRETEEFFDLVVRKIKNEIYNNKWRRIKFSVDLNDLKSKLKQGMGIEEKTPYMVQIDNLEPQKLLVFHNENGEFYTMESLGKFKFDNKVGEEAVKEALKQGFKYFALEDDPDKNLLNESIKPDENSMKIEEYYPLIEINKSPLSLRLIVPALDFIKIIELIKKLYDERFKKVLGKLPLNVKLLVAKRKFPLYILLDAESRMLEGEEFKKQIRMNPWWDINGMRDDKYYGFYPTESVVDNKKYALCDLSPISKGKIFYLYPGYFDFELLLGTTDRYHIYYESTKRGSEDYKLFTGRPYYLYQISEMLELWDVLSANLSSSQINFIEEMLTSKLREWRNVEDRNKQNVLREFAEATLKDAFGGKWNRLRDEIRWFFVNSALGGLLFDTIILFRNIIKIEGDENV
ncbi:MAG: hypothetical protein PWQ16_1120 [bacterium]|nr:hypothetical protein [bacterium]